MTPLIRTCISLLKLCLYLVPFLGYSASNSGITVKSGLEVVQGRWNGTLFDVKKYRDLEVWVRYHWGSLQILLVPFESLGTTVSCSHSIATTAVCCIVSEIQRDIARKPRFFHTPRIRRPAAPSEYCHVVWYGFMFYASYFMHYVLSYVVTNFACFCFMCNFYVAYFAFIFNYYVIDVGPLCFY